ncbi:putative DNA-binding domain-containing protein [Luteolibacter pohnpeiensis]|uniref:DNA-binding domain-containing protein n=1 Tax=Luteolibacter pohnpeiensis TaxID=454153 RepID=A0A934S5P3_9BACT|nr:DNA-binding domain-containing protein [Luteolibacter pohnpeiensis]MBK1883570.1 putative DNA-binding domain-containing protein [Luteolibacter pohnpeiensis]
MKPLLEATQKEFFTALLEPLRGSSRMATDFTPTNDPHSDHFLQVADRLVRPGPNLTPAEGLELYHRQYWFRLIDSLAEDFPGLRRLLGETRFWQLIESYLLSHPSRSFTLRHLGQSLPPMVTESEGEFAGSVAQVEWTMMLAFEAAQLPLPDAVSFTESRIQLQPHVHILELPVAAGKWLDREATDILPFVREPSLVVVWRTHSGSVVHRTVDRAALPMLAALRQGGLLEHLLAEVEKDLPDTEQVFEWFRDWQQLGWFGVSTLQIS